MGEYRRKRCIFGCNHLATQNAPLHGFPNPEKRSELFAHWVAAVGSYLKETDPKKVHTNKKVCDHHFEHSAKARYGRLICSAVPSINLYCVQQTNGTIVDADHTYSRPKREYKHFGPPKVNTDKPESLEAPDYQHDVSISEQLPDVESEDISVPSKSSTLTRLAPFFKSDERHNKPMQKKKFDAYKTFQFLQKKMEMQYLRRERVLKNEITRLRQRVNKFKLRLQEIQKKQKITKVVHVYNYDENNVRCVAGVEM